MFSIAETQEIGKQRFTWLRQRDTINTGIL